MQNMNSRNANGTPIDMDRAMKVKISLLVLAGLLCCVVMFFVS